MSSKKHFIFKLVILIRVAHLWPFNAYRTHFVMHKFSRRMRMKFIRALHSDRSPLSSSSSLNKTFFFFFKKLRYGRESILRTQTYLWIILSTWFAYLFIWVALEFYYYGLCDNIRQFCIQKSWIKWPLTNPRQMLWLEIDCVRISSAHFYQSDFISIWKMSTRCFVWTFLSLFLRCNKNSPKIDSNSCKKCINRSICFMDVLRVYCHNILS